MDQLDESAAAHIASFLEDERDLAALRATSRSWAALLAGDPALWRTLAVRRFGPAAVAATTAAGGAGGAPAAAAMAAAQARAPPLGSAAEEQRRFRSLAARRVHAAAFEHLVWLDGVHLERIQDPSATSGAAVRVKDVWWLDVGGRVRGVLPGRYRPAWRLRLEPHFLLPEGRLVTRLELPAAGRGGGGGGASAAADATDAGEAAAGAAAGAAAAAGEVLETSTAIDPDALYHYRQQAGGAWLQLLGSSFEVPRRCDVWVALTATDSMLYKRGLVLDSVRLLRLPPAAPAAAAAPEQGPGGGGALAAFARGLRGLRGLLGRAPGGS